MSTMLSQLLQKWIAHRAFNALICFVDSSPEITDDEHQDCVCVLDLLRRKM